MALVLRWRARRQRLGVGGRCAVAVGVLAASLASVPLTAPDPGSAGPPPGGLTVRMLDVGQGDSILLQPSSGAPILFDAGPPDAGVAERLDQLGVDRLAALVATHPSLDHLGGVGEVLDRVGAARIVFGRIDPRTLTVARGSGAQLTRIAAGDGLRIGRLRLEVLSPPASELRAARAVGARAAGDPNRLALVVLAHWGEFELLLTADAEAELAPVDPGPIDVLKVAHHGSADSGLGGLLDRAHPSLALISVGAGNRYGHPTQATLAELAAAGVETMRTDRDGEIVVDVAESAWGVR